MNQSNRFLTAGKRVLRIQEFGVALALILLYLILGFATEHFFSFENFVGILRQTSFIGIMALGFVFVLSMGDVDLSVGAIYNIAGIVCALLLTYKLPIWVAVVAALVVGAVCGLVNIGLALAFNIPTIIITLGTTSIFTGLGLVLCQSRPLYDFPKTHWFFTVVGVTIGKFPTQALILLVLTVIMFIIYGFTVFGTRVRAIGANLNAAKFTGINVVLNRVYVFVLMGVLSAFSGIMEISFLQASSPSMGVSTNMNVIAAAIIGGTALSGGSGSIIGALIGALIISVIRNGIVQVGVSTYWSSTVTGIVIIIAVAIDYLFKRTRNS
jgi:ribose transport system permease protein